MSEYTLYFSVFEAHVRSGALCRGPHCPGWFSSQIDTWHACPCNPKRENHPEEEVEEGVTSDSFLPAPTPLVLPHPSDDSIPF